MRLVILAVCAAALTGCATPYQDMGYLGGVRATQITGDTFQIAAKGNAYTSAETIQRYALRKAAETTVNSGFDLFLIGDRQDRTRQDRMTSGGFNSSGGFNAYSAALVKPGETLMVRMFKGAKPADAPSNLFDAREVLRYLGS